VFRAAAALAGGAEPRTEVHPPRAALTLNAPLSAPPQPPRPEQRRRGGGALVLIAVGAAAIALLVWPLFPGLTLAAVLATLLMPPLVGVIAIVGTEAVAGIEWLRTHEGVGQTPDAVRGTLARTASQFGADPATVVSVVEGQVRRVGELVASRTLSFLSGIPG